MNPPLSQRLFLLICALACTALVGASNASAASSGKLKLIAPSAGTVPVGKIAIRAKLTAKRSARVRRARFYLNGKRVTTDRRYPFQIKKGVTFDTRLLGGVSGVITIKARIDRRSRSGKLLRRSLSKKVRIEPATPPGSVQSATKCPPPMTLCEEFNGNSLDTSTWNTQRGDPESGTFPWYPYSAHLEGAAYSTSPNNVSVSGGVLSLTVTNDAGGNAAHPYSKSTGMINSDGKFAFKYGYIEARARVSKCSACWQSFWLHTQSHQWPPEIDIFEFITSESEPSPYTTIHAPDDSYVGNVHTHDIKRRVAGVDADLTEAWHTYGMRWTPEWIEFNVDGVHISRIEQSNAIPQVSMYPILLMAIGDPAKAAEVGMTITPAPAGVQLQVDYVRVWPDTAS